jgi:hypothetical protein
MCRHSAALFHFDAIVSLSLSLLCSSRKQSKRNAHGISQVLKRSESTDPRPELYLFGAYSLRSIQNPRKKDLEKILQKQGLEFREDHRQVCPLLGKGKKY